MVALHSLHCHNRSSFDSRFDHLRDNIMRLGTASRRPLIIGTAALILAMGLLGASALAQEDAKTSKAERQPQTGKGKEDKSKKDDLKSPSIKLGLSVNAPSALQGYTLMSPFVSTNTYLVDMQGR